MPDKVIDIPGVGPTAFPDSMSDAEVNAASTRLYQGANPGKKQPPVKTWTDTAVDAAGDLLTSAVAAKVASPVVSAAADMAMNPNMPKTVGAAARYATTVGTLGRGIATGSLSDIVAAPMAGWTAGKGGYFLGKGAQALISAVRGTPADSPEMIALAAKVNQSLGPGTAAVSSTASGPIAKVMTYIAPYAQSLATLGGAQSLLDLAQVAEPNRQDIGTLGVSVGQPRSDAEKTAHPALLNMLAGKVQEGIQALMHYGLSREDAVKAISDQTIRR